MRNRVYVHRVRMGDRRLSGNEIGFAGLMRGEDKAPSHPQMISGK